MPTVLQTDKRTARKEHKCDYCGQTIPIGEKYENQTNVYDGELYHWKAHLSCQKLVRELDMDCDYDEGITQENFYESVRSYLDDNGIEYSNWLDGLAKVKAIFMREVQ